MAAFQDTKSNAILKTVGGHATLQDMAEWQQALNLLLGSRGHSAHTAYVRAPIDVNGMKIDDTSEEGLLDKYPMYGEVDQELLKRTICTAHGITPQEMDLDQNRDLRAAIKKAMAIRLLAYDEKKAIIAGIMMETIDEAIKRRILTTDAASIASQEPRILYYLILHLVAPDMKARLREVNQLHMQLNTMTPSKDEDLDAFHQRYTKSLRILLTLGHKEPAMERITHFIKATAANSEWLTILEREEQMAPGEWFRGEIRGSPNVSSHNFAHMCEIVVGKLRAVQGFRTWVRPTATGIDTVQAHSVVSTEGTPKVTAMGPTAGVTPIPDKCKWCSEVLNHKDVTHSMATCYQIQGLIEGYTKGDHGAALLAVLSDIARAGTQPRYLTRDRAFSAAPPPGARRSKGAANARGPAPKQQAPGQPQSTAETAGGQQAEQPRAYAATASASNTLPDPRLSFMYENTEHHHAYVTTKQGYAAQVPADTVMGDYIIWDSGCDTNTFCDRTLVTNCIDIEPRVIKGVGTGTANSAGDSIFGDAIINPQQGVNLVSQSYIRDNGLYQFRYDENQDAFVVWSDSVTLHFRRLGGLYALHREDKDLCSAMRQHATANAFIAFINTPITYGFANTINPDTGEANTLLPRHARERAALARRLHLTLGHPGVHAMEKATVDLANTNLTANDIRTMESLYGPCIACDQGKAKQKISGGNYHPATLPGEVLHADLITVPTGVKTTATLIVAVDELTGYGLVVDVVAKSESPLLDKMLEIINFFRGRGAHVRKIKTDPENALRVLKPGLLRNGVEYEACPVGEHEKHAEAHIGALRAKVRAMEAGMHFYLPLSLSTYLVKAANRLMNLVPTYRSGHMSPHTAIHEVRPDARHLVLMFGEAVLVTDPGEHTGNTVRQERSNLAIYLGQSDDSPQSGNFLMLSTLTVKSRGLSTARPTPHGEHINQLISPLYKGAPYSQENGIDRIITAQDRLDYIKSTRPSSKPAAPDVQPTTDYDPTADKGDADNKTSAVNGETAGNKSDGSVAADETTPAAHKGGDETTAHTEPTGSLDSPTVNGTRRSTRRSKLPQHLAACATVALLCTLARDIRHFGKPGEDAAIREIRQVLDTEALLPTHTPSVSWRERKEALQCKLFLEEKRGGRIKGRIVGGTGASSQDKSKYQDLSSPTVRFETVALLLKSAATTGMQVAVADIPGAYLHAKFQDMTTEGAADNKRYIVAKGMLAKMMGAVDAECARCMDKDTGDLYLQLNKALYGLIEAAKLWYSEISNMLLGQGFKQSLADPCLFMHEERQLLVGLYVDDMITLYKSKSDLQWFLSLLEAKYGPPRVQSGDTVDYLNVEITRLQRNAGQFPAGSFVASQEKYLRKLKEMHPDWFWRDATALAPHDETLFSETNAEPADNPADFTSLVMAFLYVCTRARPDIFLGISYLCTRTKSPTKGDEEKLRRLCSYVNNTIQLVLVFSPSEQMQVMAWIDASYAVHEDAKSHSGTVITAGLERGSPTFIRSRKQKLVSRSSTEAELIALHDGSPQVTWTRQLLEELGHTQGPATIFQDNKSTIFMAEKGAGNFNRTRHIAVRYFSIKELVDDKVVNIQYLPTGQMIADPMTKPVTGSRFIEWRNSILFQNPIANLNQQPSPTYQGGNAQ